MKRLGGLDRGVFMAKPPEEREEDEKRDEALKRALAMPPQPKKKPKPEEIETHADGWERFTKTIETVAPPKRKPKTKSEKSQKR